MDNKKRSSKKQTSRNRKNVDKNVIKIKSSFESKNFIYTKKLRVALIVTILIFILLICRIGFLQFVQGSSLKENIVSVEVVVGVGPKAMYV